MEKILVLGCSGSDRPAFTAKLKKMTNYPTLYLDKIYRIDDTHHISREELSARAEYFAKTNNQYIIDGNYKSSLPQRVALADTIVVLDFAPEDCLQFALNKCQKHHEAGFDNLAKKEQFLKNVQNFKTTVMPIIDDLAKKHPQKQFVILNDFKQLNQFATKLQNDFSKTI